MLTQELIGKPCTVYEWLGETEWQEEWDQGKPLPVPWTVTTEEEGGQQAPEVRKAAGVIRECSLMGENPRLLCVVELSDGTLWRGDSQEHNFDIELEKGTDGSLTLTWGSPCGSDTLWKDLWVHIPTV